MYAVAGQHDLRYHNLDDISHSAYQTLVQAELITDLTYGYQHLVQGTAGIIWAWGFPWGKPLVPHSSFKGPRDATPGLNLAVAHSYIWTNHCGHVGAPTDKYLGSYKKSLKGYDAAVFGDNHVGFTVQMKTGCWVHNNGTLMRRRGDERHLKPRIGLLQESGRITPYFLDTSQDRYTDNPILNEATPERIDAEDLLADLQSLGDRAVDFAEAVLKYLKHTPVADGVRRRLLDAVGAGDSATNRS